MRQLVIVSILLGALWNTILFCGGEEVHVTSIRDVPAAYAALMHKVAQQPLFTGFGSVCKQMDLAVKILPCDSCDAELATLLWHQNASIPYSLLAFGCGNNRRSTDIDIFRSEDLGFGLEFVPSRAKKTDFVDLEKKFARTITNLMVGWNQENPTEHEDICIKENVDEWYLFIKDKTHPNDDKLVNVLADKLECSIHVICSSEYTHKLMYLWIKKNHFEYVRDLLDLKIEQ